MTAHDWIDHLSMKPHPEGGWFSESYSRAPMFLPKLSAQHYSGERRLYSSIYYLLEEGDFSAFHQLETDEMWHHYQGGVLRVFMIDSSGSLTVRRLGGDAAGSAVFQLLVPHHTWFAVEPEAGSGFALCGCTLTPGYSDDDFRMAKRDELIEIFPLHSDLIKRLTR